MLNNASDSGIIESHLFAVIFSTDLRASVNLIPAEVARALVAFIIVPPRRRHYCSALLLLCHRRRRERKMGLVPPAVVRGSKKAEIIPCHNTREAKSQRGSPAKRNPPYRRVRPAALLPPANDRSVPSATARDPSNYSHHRALFSNKTI